MPPRPLSTRSPRPPRIAPRLGAFQPAITEGYSFSDFLRDLGIAAKANLELTGVPQAIREPSPLNIGLAAASLTPFTKLGGVSLKATKAARGKLAKEVKPLKQPKPIPVRKIPIGKLEASAKIPAARSPLGRPIEKLFDAAYGKVAPSLQTKKALREIGFQTKREARIQAATFSPKDLESLGAERLKELGLSPFSPLQSLEKKIQTEYIERIFSKVPEFRNTSEFQYVMQKFRLLDRQINLPSTGKNIAKIAVDTANDTFRISVITLNAPGYFGNNAPANWLLNIIHAPFTAPQNLFHSVRLYRSLDDVGKKRLTAMAGTGWTKALEQGLEAGGRIRRPLDVPGLRHAQFGIAKITDKWPRMAALTHELRSQGYKTPEQVKKFMSSKRNAPKRALIAQRANEALVDFERLTPFEREIVGRGIAFYPWVKGAWRFAVRSPLDRPISTALAGGAAAAFYEKDRPPFARFVVPVGEDRVINPFRLHPGLAAAETTESVVNTLLGRPGVFSVLRQLSPAAAGGIGLLTGRGEFGERMGARAALDPLMRLPPERAIRQLILGEEKKGVFPVGSRKEALIPFLGGTALTPRRFAPEAAAREKAQTIQEEWAERRSSLVRESESFGIQVPPEVMSSLDLYEQSSIREQALKQELGVKKLTSRQQAATILDAWVENGTIDEAKATEIVNIMSKATPSQQLDLLRRMEKSAFGEYRSFRTRVTRAINRRKAIEELRKKGVAVP